MGQAVRAVERFEFYIGHAEHALRGCRFDEHEARRLDEAIKRLQRLAAESCTPIGGATQKQEEPALASP